MLKRVALIAAALILVTATAVAAASTMGVSINGKAVTFKTAPEMKNNTVMVPLAELAEALGIEAKWNLNTNTLEVTDARAKRITELEARVKELESQAKTAPATTAAPAVTVTKENLIAQLQARFGSYKSGNKEFRVTWSKNPYSDVNRPLITADIAKTDYGTYKDLKGDSLLKWFDEAAQVVAKVHPEASVLLAYAGTFSDHPGYDHDKVELTDDWKWRVHDYEIWSYVKAGVTDTEWDD